ncbi:hypothetical protein [Bradyrhizobium sp. CCBAU 53351]|uniref:hypothetical protein n=1 Tax=Bradyrhizobium sp. CCBAU 53351 TaxID=1325114 RepID=UPI00188952AB|nr:hypothetical protein [Bradyrhizobium sp. CCBAU 53351]
MSDILQKLLQPRVAPNPEPEWPKWIMEALAYKPERPPAVLDPPLKAVSPESDERRNIRILRRVSNT